MEPETLWMRVRTWLIMRPIYLAYWLIWISARLGGADARAVYKAAWDAQLDLPTIPGLSNAENKHD